METGGHTPLRKASSDSQPQGQLWVHMHSARPKPARHGVGEQPLGCPPLRLSWALLPMGAHSPACLQRSVRNPKQHSWVGRREERLALGHRELQPGAPSPI